MSAGEVERLGSGKYLSLTTFRKDGTPVATPVWVARDGDELVIITDATSGKAKRIRNSGTVKIAPCDVRGKVNGTSLDGFATLTDSTGTAYIAKQIRRKYGLAYIAIGWVEKLRRRDTGGSVGIRVSVTSASED